MQNVPELFAYLRARIDRRPRRTGQWVLTGSQESTSMRGVTESMAGPAAALHLLPLSSRETPKVSLLRGGYPEVIARPAAAALWFRSHLQTYLERDVRAVTAVKDLSTSRRLLALLASRHGQILNKTELAAPLGVKTAGELARSPFLGTLFEGFVAAEIAKVQANAGRRRELYYFRDQQGLEVDFLVPGRSGSFALIECKASRTVTPQMAAPMQRLSEAMGRGRSKRVRMFLVHEAAKAGGELRTVAPGVRALPWQAFLDEL